MSNNRNLLLAGAAVLVALCALCACLAAVYAVWRSFLQPPQDLVLRDQEFEGFFISSFEVSSFMPCVGPADTPGYNNYWLSSTPESGFYAQYAEVTGKPISDQPAGITVYVRFIGDLSPESEVGYGHLGGYSREVTVTRLLEMSLDGACSP